MRPILRPTVATRQGIPFLEQSKAPLQVSRPTIQKLTSTKQLTVSLVVSTSDLV